MIIAGAPDHDIGGEPHGAAFVFLEPPEGWVTSTENQKLAAAGGGLGDELGFSVAIDTKTIAAGSLYTDVRGVPNVGSVTVFATRSR
jgi:FG-GAP repeat